MTRCYCGRRLLVNDDGTTECVRCHRQPDECRCDDLTDDGRVPHLTDINRR